MIIQSPPRAPVVALAAAAALGGALVALRYHGLDLTLAHYDARGHLVVARRIVDSITPGWQQIGAVWLPLPHLLNAVPVQVDALYRTGLSGVALSVAAFAVAVGAIAWMVAAMSGSLAAGAAGALIFALNPNVLYLQATPMTEPLLMACMLVGVASLLAWTNAEAPGHGLARWAGVALAAACLTRYEAWPVAVSALAAGAWAKWRPGATPGEAVRSVAPVAAYPLAAIASFLVFSRIVVGSWFADDFFVPENPAEGDPLASARLIVWGVQALSGSGLVAAAIVGLVVILLQGLTRRDRGALLVPLGLVGAAAVPWAAFLDGHPYRIRYMVPLVAAQAVYAGVAAGCWPPLRRLAIPAVLAAALVELRPLDRSAPMVLEAQWDRSNMVARETVTGCLAPAYGGETVMASMGSLGHYMQDLSRSGFRLRDFLHEGNGDIWLNALSNPRPYAGWMLIEERAEGGDMLAKLARERPAFLTGYARRCEAAGLALYERDRWPGGEQTKARSGY